MTFAQAIRPTIREFLVNEQYVFMEEDLPEEENAGGDDNNDVDTTVGGGAGSTSADPTDVAMSGPANVPTSFAPTDTTNIISPQ